jgi:hypothetical protein
VDFRIPYQRLSAFISGRIALSAFISGRVALSAFISGRVALSAFISVYQRSSVVGSVFISEY